jgi:hypothetical protein
VTVWDEAFQKLLPQLREICYPVGAKDLNSPVLKSYSQLQKVFALNGKEFINSIKFKGLLK